MRPINNNSGASPAHAAAGASSGQARADTQWGWRSNKPFPPRRSKSLIKLLQLYKEKKTTMLSMGKKIKRSYWELWHTTNSPKWQEYKATVHSSMQTQNPGNKSQLSFYSGSFFKEGSWILQYPVHLYFSWGLSITTGTVTGDSHNAKQWNEALSITNYRD